MINSSLAPLANHLWQSTIFASAAAVLALALRRNHARARHALWLAASVKLLIPFALLVGLGSHLALKTPARQAGRVSLVVERIEQPFAPVTPIFRVAAPIPIV